MKGGWGQTRQTTHATWITAARWQPRRYGNRGHHRSQAAGSMCHTLTPGKMA